MAHRVWPWQRSGSTRTFTSLISGSCQVGQRLADVGEGGRLAVVRLVLVGGGVAAVRALVRLEVGRLPALGRRLDDGVAPGRLLRGEVEGCLQSAGSEVGVLR